MKRLITMMAAAALGAFAWAETDFDNTGYLPYTVSPDFDEGVTNIVGYADDAQTSVFDNGDVYWWATNYPTASAEKDTYEQPIEVATETINNESKKVFKIETDAATPLLRTFNKTIGTETPTGSDVYTFDRAKQPIADNGLFADSMIKLSASEEPPATCNGKIAVWLQVIPEDTEADTAGSTNLMVTCGVLNQDTYEVSGTTNIVISAEGVEIAPDTWHRVTIRTIKTIKDGKNVPGFVIWVDGELAKAAAGAYELPTVDGKGARFNTLNALFASASSDSGEATTLDSVGFAGSGALQKIDLTDMLHAPDFAVDPTYVHLMWDENVTGVTIDGVALDNTVIGNRAYDYHVTNFTAAVSVALTLRDNPPYKVASITPDTGIVSDIATDKTTFKFTANKTFDDSQMIAIATVQDREGVEVKVGQDTINVPFLKDAVKYIVDNSLTASAVSFKLLLNEEGSDFGDFSKLKEVTIDLNGCSLTAKDWAPAWDTLRHGAIFDTVAGNKLTIIDSSVTGGGAIIGIIGATAEDSVLAFYNDGQVVIEDAVGTKPISITGGAYNTICDDQGESEMTINGGRFNPTIELVNEYVTLPEGKVWSENTDTDGFYTIVDEDEPPTPTGTVIIIGANGEPKGSYATLTAAIDVAVAGDTVTLTENLTLTETLAIAKATAINLAGKTLTLSGDTTGIKISADSVVVTNGTIASALAANASKSKAIDVSYANVTFKDLTINAGHYEYALYANCDEEAAKGGRTTEVDQLAWFYAQENFKKLDCDNVTIHGNGSLFHVEGMEATLNNCSAIRDSNTLFGASHHQAAVYSSVNACTTITGSGTYTHVNALQSGNLGGKIIVANDSTAVFTGNIKSYMKVGAHTELETVDAYKAAFTFNAGTYTGNIVFEDADARTLDSFTKGADVTIDAPTGFTWLNDTTLTKVYTITWVGSENIVVSNGTAQVDATSGSYAKDTVLKFYAMVGAITNVTVNGETQTVANPFEYTVGEAAATIVVLAGEDQPDLPVDDDVPLNDTGKANVTIAVNAIKAAGEEPADWVETVYGKGGKIPAAKLNAETADVALAVANDLPITAAEPTFEVAASTVSADTNVAAFEFTLKDGSDAVEIKTLTEKVKAMVKYTEALGTTTPFAPAQENTDVTIALTTGDEGAAGKIKVELIKKTDVNAGFMKVEPNQPAQ